MSVFRMIKYSALLYFLGKYKQKVFRITAVLLFAGGNVIAVSGYRRLSASSTPRHRDLCACREDPYCLWRAYFCAVSV